MEPPILPENKDLTYIGYATFRDRNHLFGIKRKDRRQHIYILGKSGTGKSSLMFNMIYQNIKNGEGVCLVDPHGENVEHVLASIPPDRVKDVVYFNPADTEYHIGFNVLEIVDPKYKNLVSSGLMGIFTKIWANAWSARMEYILNNTILALLDTPGTTLLGIPRMLVDKDYRQKIISNLKDPVIKAFWVHEYEAWQEKFRNEAIAPIQNKVGQFLSSAIIRNVVGQSKSTINIFDIMNEGKIFLVNVSKGRIGEDNSRLLGGMIITKIQLAAMERVRIPEDERKDFYLYVDEFQNFVTDSFASILSEARKYRLNLTVAHQYTAQLVTKESSAMRDSIFGNVGTMIIFRVGADDADFLEKEFEPEFVPQDIVSLPNYKIYLKLMIDGVTSRPFSAKTMPELTKAGNMDIAEAVIKSSRELYCRSKEEIEKEINNWSGVLGGEESQQNSGPLEKFPAICSLCKAETTVPFKPEPGRPVYCKDCITKIKAGELKPIKSSFKDMRLEESTYHKPLSDLGIEFPSNYNSEAQTTPRQQSVPTNNEKRQDFGPKPREINNTRGGTPFVNKNGAPKSGIMGTFKKVFNKDEAPRKTRPMGENTALREILSRTLAENKAFEVKEPVKMTPQNIENKDAPVPISLNDLKIQKQVSQNTLRDRSAPAEEMNKLKSLITEKAELAEVKLPQVPPQAPQQKEKTEPAVTLVEPKEEPQPSPNTTADEEKSTTSQNEIKPAEPPKQGFAGREVPEEVLRKILNGEE